MNFNNIPKQQQQQTLNIQSNSSFDAVGFFILIAMLIKSCAQIPIIIKVTQTKSAEDISIIMPIMFLLSFSILSMISLRKQLYKPFLIFLIGIISSIILIIQKLAYEKSKKK
jgi:uncharacterized protein with PQ loop repeat